MEQRFVPVVSGKPGERTLENFLKIAMMPVGSTLYIYGGGWDLQDIGASMQTRTLGVSSEWRRFFREHDAGFDYRKIDSNKCDGGLDCSGYLGWVIYNTFETTNERNGYVCKSTEMAHLLAEREWGTWTQSISFSDKYANSVVNPGDIVSIVGHVWVSLGTCSDGSVVILHSTPSESRTGQPGGGVQISAIGADESCEAFFLADYYMSKYYPEWYVRYRTVLKKPEVYFAVDSACAGRFSWDVSKKGKGLTDSIDIQNMLPEAVLNMIFEGSLSIIKS